MPMNRIPLFFDERSTSKRINMTSVLKKTQLAMHKTVPDIKSSVQKYQSSVHVSDVFWIAALTWLGRS